MIYDVLCTLPYLPSLILTGSVESGFMHTWVLLSLETIIMKTL